MKTFTLCLHFVLALTLVCFVPCRLAAEEVDSLESDTASRWQGVCLSRASPTPPESAATVKSLIKSFDLGCSGIWTLYFVVKEFLAVSRTCFLLLEGCFLSVHGCGRSLQWPSVVPWSDKRVIVGFEIQIFFFPLFFHYFFHYFSLQVAVDKISQFTRCPGALSVEFQWGQPQQLLFPQCR